MAKVKTKPNLNLLLKDRDDLGIDIVNRIIYFTGEISSLQSLEFLDARLTLLEKDGDDEIIIKINSPGGCIYESSGMAGRITSSPCTIITDVTGIAMSGAVSLLAVGDIRRVSKFASIMHHEARTLFIGRTGKLERDVEILKQEDHRRMQFLADYTNKPVSWWHEICKNGDYYITPEEALAIGLVDEVY
ncbi:MAG TPA: ATP-dependent Clp protease proteolytic subunit [Yeosuana sp.]